MWDNKYSRPKTNGKPLLPLRLVKVIANRAAIYNNLFINEFKNILEMIFWYFKRF